MGDFNINLLNTKTNTSISELYNNISSHSFALYFFQPTRLTKSSKAIINNILLNSIEFENFSGNLTYLMSDKLPKLLY